MNAFVGVLTMRARSVQPAGGKQKCYTASVPTYSHTVLMATYREIANMSAEELWKENAMKAWSIVVRILAEAALLIDVGFHARPSITVVLFLLTVRAEIEDHLRSRIDLAIGPSNKSADQLYREIRSKDGD
jgi:hypothetical protein